MKAENNLKLIARGAFLGYLIALALLCVFSIPDFVLFGLCLNISFFAMGVGIVTELSFSARSFREKLSLYLVGVFFSPPIYCYILFSCIDYLTTGTSVSGVTFILFFFFFALLSVLGVLYLKKAKIIEFLSYIMGYLAVFVAFVISFYLAFAFQESIRDGIDTLIIFVLTFVFSVLSVLLTKKIISNLIKEKL